jgi:xylulose-5-phosphate/fructose-6-phosphate phosphoketolase
MAAALETAFDRIRAIQKKARDGSAARLRPTTWPMIVLRSPKGWTGPNLLSRSLDGPVFTD